MGSYSHIAINNYPISSTKNYFDRWYFKKSDRVIRLRKKSERNTMVWSAAEAHVLDEEETDYLYVIAGSTLRRRLELAGFNRETLEQEFRESIATRLAHFEDISEHEWAKDKATISIELLKNTDLSEWIACLKIVIDNGLKAWNWDKRKQDFVDPRIGYLLEEDYWSDEIKQHDLNFPCATLECLAVAMLDIVPETVDCVLNVTDLVHGGWTDAFEDLIEFSKDHTTFYEVFNTAIYDTRSLIILSPENKTLARLLYANVISAMETYLADTIKKQVLNRQSIKRRFIQTSDSFREKIPVSDIFKKLDRLNEEIINAIDTTSFHNLDRVTGLYKAVLDTHFPADLLPQLKKAIENRHDIVHRNGKDTKGQPTGISMADVEKLIELVDTTVQSLDKQIKDGLIEDEDE